MKAFHTITEANLKSIKKSNILKPNTPFFQDIKDKINYGNPRKEFEEALDMKYICAIPKSRIKSWIKSGFIEEINFFIKPDYALEFEVPKDSFKFVREHSYTSPVETKRRFGLDRFRKVSEPAKTKIWKRYLKSNKIIKNSKGFKGIKVPELWINSKIPMNKIRVIKFSSLEKI